MLNRLTLVQGALAYPRRLIIQLADHTGFAPVSLRSPSSYGWFAKYDANVVGGAMQGIGMVLSGACPGTVFVQIGTGIPSGLYSGLGCVLGGILFARFGLLLRRPVRTPSDISTKPNAESNTLQGKLNLPVAHVALAYEVMCAASLALAITFSPQRYSLLEPILGGLLLGIGQASSVLLTRKTIGVSGSFAELGRIVWHRMGHGKEALSTSSMTFAAGILAGSWALKDSVPSIPMQDMQIAPTTAILGGLVMVFGARLAGGCTSGHGISGMATFSIASFVTVAAMFGGGIMTSRLLA
jgi:uncharacterized membrane protein YedE/YeeE